MSHIIVSNTHKSRLSNPCPDGTGIGYGDWNGTILLICAAAFDKANSEELALGLGLGLGIPAALGILALLIFCLRCPVRVEPFKGLSKRVHEDLVNNILSVKLKRELLALHAKKRDMSKFVRLAQSYNAMEIAVWIECLIRGEPEIQIEMVD